MVQMSEDGVSGCLDSEQPSCAFLTANKVSFEVTAFLDVLVHACAPAGE